MEFLWHMPLHEVGMDLYTLVKSVAHRELASSNLTVGDALAKLGQNLPKLRNLRLLKCGSIFIYALELLLSFEVPLQ